MFTWLWGIEGSRGFKGSTYVARFPYLPISMPHNHFLTALSRVRVRVRVRARWADRQTDRWTDGQMIKE